MKLKFGAIITEGVGKLGGHDFINSRYGPNLRTRSLRTSKVSQPESFRKGILRKVSTGWRELTQVQRDAWNNWADSIDWNNSFYGTIKLSGEQLFCKINALYYNWSGIAWSNPPAFSNTVQSQFTSVTVYGSGGPLILYWENWVPVNSWLYIWATPPLSQGVTTKPKFFKYIGRVQTLDPTPVDFYDRYIAVFGSVGEPGSKILFKSYVFNVVSGYQLIPTYPQVQLPVFYICDRQNNRILGYFKLPFNNFSKPDILWGQSSWFARVKPDNTNVLPTNVAIPTGIYSLNKLLFIVEPERSRILVFTSPPLKPSDSPAFCIGEPDLYTGHLPGGLPASSTTLSNPLNCFSDGTRLFVSDRDNNRILIWNTVPTTFNVPADVVIGQTNFTNSNANQGGSVSAAGLSSPRHIYFSGGKLIIADSGNHRILIYNSIPTVHGVSANVVVGQPDFLSSSVNRGGSVSINSLNSPDGCSVKNGRLYIADSNNHRVLIFSNIPSVSDPNAALVIGQPDFTSNTAFQGIGPRANTLNKPNAPTFIGNRMLLPDKAGQRILIFNSLPTQLNESADSVIGQPNLNTSTTYLGPASLRPFLNKPNSVNISEYSYP